MTCMNQRIAALAAKVLAGSRIDRDESLSITKVAGEDLHDLLYWSNKIRLHFIGPSIACCSIVASKVGACEQNCRLLQPIGPLSHARAGNQAAG